MLVMEQTLKLFSTQKKNLKLIPKWNGGEHNFPIFIPGESAKTHYFYQSLHSESILQTEFALNKITTLRKFKSKIKKILASNYKQEGIWEIDVCVTADIIQEDSERPYLPIVLFGVESKTRLINIIVMGKNGALNSNFYSNLIASFREESLIPEEICCTTTQVFAFLKPLCKQFNIKITQMPDLSVWHDVLQNSREKMDEDMTPIASKIPFILNKKKKKISPTTIESSLRPTGGIRVVSLDTQLNPKKITPNLFYNCKPEKNLFNWFLFEVSTTISKGLMNFDAEFGQIKGFKRTLIHQYALKIINSHIEFFKSLQSAKKNLLKKKYLQAIFPAMSLENLDELFFQLKSATNLFATLCRNCPTKCLKYKTTHCTMFDQPFYSR